MAKFASGHIGVMRRIGKERLPIKQLYGPSVPQMAGEPGVKEVVVAGAEERFGKRLDHETKRLLNKG